MCVFHGAGRRRPSHRWHLRQQEARTHAGAQCHLVILSSVRKTLRRNETMRFTARPGPGGICRRAPSCELGSRRSRSPSTSVNDPLGACWPPPAPGRRTVPGAERHLGLRRNPRTENREATMRLPGSQVAAPGLTRPRCWEGAVAVLSASPWKPDGLPKSQLRLD